MKALILNTQVCQVEEQDFPVAEPLYWVTCPDDVTTNWTYVDNTFVPPALPSPPTADENKATATGLLQATDWVNQPDVRNTANNPHLLNGDEFDTYRLAVRQYAVNPVAGDINWPTLPAAQWSN